MRPLHWQLIQSHLREFLLPSGAALEKLNSMSVGVAVKILGDFYETKDYSFKIPQNNLRGFCHASAVFRIFGIRGVKIFKIAREFGQVLVDLKCDISAKYLHFDDSIYCIEFPDGMSFDMGDGDSATCAYVAMLRKSEKSLIQCEGIDYDFLMDMIVPLYRDGEIYGNDNIRLYLNTESNIEAALTEAISHISGGRSTGFTPALLSYIVNCLLYLNSGEPDLRHLRPEPKPKNAKAIKKWRRTEESKLPCPITLVGFDYLKPREFHVGESFVKSHKRWQPYGPGREKVKLIWVRAHTRHYGEEK